MSDERDALAIIRANETAVRAVAAHFQGEHLGHHAELLLALAHDRRPPQAVCDALSLDLPSEPATGQSSDHTDAVGGQAATTTVTTRARSARIRKYILSEDVFATLHHVLAASTGLNTDQNDRESASRAPRRGEPR